MTQIQFTIKNEEIQSLIDTAVNDQTAKMILTTVFNQLMEEQRTAYLQARGL